MPKMSIQPTVSLSRYSHTSTAQFYTSRPTATGRSTSSYTKGEAGGRGCASRRRRRTRRVALCAPPPPPAAGRGERGKKKTSGHESPRAPFPTTLFFFTRVPLPPPANRVGPEEWGYMSVSGWPGVRAVERGPTYSERPGRAAAIM